MSEQVYERVKSLLAPGQCEVGGRFPTSRELAERFEVSLGTAQSAVRRLEEEGFVSCFVGRGTFVERTFAAPENARSLGTTTFGVLVEKTNIDLSHPREDWVASILYGFQHGLIEDGVAMKIVANCEATAGDVARTQHHLTRITPDLSGLLVFPFAEIEKLVPVFDATGIPWVAINQVAHAHTSNFVSADYYGAGLEAGRFFADLGLERILYLKPKGSNQSSLLREHGLRDGLLGPGSSSEVQVLECEDHLMRSGMNAMHACLPALRMPPQGIFASGDFLAMGAIRACQEHNLRVPEDVAVIGSTGIEAGEHFSPTLTTLRMPMVRMGFEAAHMLVALKNGKSQTLPGKILPAEFLERGSTPTRPVPSNRS